MANVRSEVKKIERELGTLLDLILKGCAAEAINARKFQLEGRKLNFSGS